MLMRRVKPLNYHPFRCVANLYNEEDFEGLVLRVIVQRPHFSSVASMILTGPCRWIAYSIPNFNGLSFVLEVEEVSNNVYRGNYASPSEWGSARNNGLSSIRSLPPIGSNTIVLFDHELYR